MSNDNSAGLILILIIFWAITSGNADDNKHTIYQLACLNFDAQGTTCPDRRYPIKTSYRVIPERDIVTNNSLSRFENCDIFDGQNWSCKTKFEYITMRDGELIYSPINEAYDSSEEYKAAFDKLVNQSLRSPQVPNWMWHIYQAYHFTRNIIG